MIISICLNFETFKQMVTIIELHELFKNLNLCQDLRLPCYPHALASLEFACKLFLAKLVRHLPSG